MGLEKISIPVSSVEQGLYEVLLVLVLRARV